MKDLVIFGAGKIAEVAHYYLYHEGGRNVVGFTVDREFIAADRFKDLPVVPFERVTEYYPPDRCDLFVALGYQNLNGIRALRVQQAKEKGYQLPGFIHPAANLPKDTPMGENCFILGPVCIQPVVTIGNNVFIWSGAIVGHHSTIGDHCWITSGANISGMVTVGTHCFFAINSTVANGIRVGDRCFLGSNTLVTKDLKDGAVVIAASTPVYRLNSEEFLRISKFH